MEFGLRILPPADQDFDDYTMQIAADSIEQAIRFTDNSDRTVQMILSKPNCWAIYGFKRPHLADLRKRSIIGFPNHLIFYRIDADMVEIVRVVHGHRDIPRVFGDEP